MKVSRFMCCCCIKGANSTRQKVSCKRKQQHEAFRDLNSIGSGYLGGSEKKSIKWAKGEAEGFNKRTCWAVVPKSWGFDKEVGKTLWERVVRGWITT